jgi:oxygen-dependent protoporphyrinogen oxidase
VAVVVAGAGITGLAAALALAEAGRDVVVVDPSERIGGMLRTSPFAGRMVDEAADAFLVRTPAALDLARRVGLGDELVHPARRDARTWLDGRLVPLPAHVMGVPIDPDEVARLDLLSPVGLVDLRADLAAPRDGHLPEHDVSLAEAVAGRIGAEAHARLVDPLVSGISAGDPARLSLAACVPQLDAAWRDPDHASLVAACRAQVARARAAGADPAAPIFAAPAGGMARLPASVAHAARLTGLVEVRLGVGLDAVEPGPRAVLSDGSTIEAEGVVVATPGPAAARALAPLAPDAAALLAAVDHVSVAFVRLALAPDELAHPLEGSGILVPRASGLAVTACSWASEKWAHLAPSAGDGTALVRAAVGRDGDQAALDLDDDALVERVVADLGSLVGLDGAPRATSVHRWTGAFPQYRPGHLDRVAATEAALAAADPRVAVAGMHLRGVGIPASVASAHLAVGRILEGSPPPRSA